MSLQMESWFLQAVRPGGEYLILPSTKRHQQAQTGPSDLPQQDLPPVNYCTQAALCIFHLQSCPGATMPIGDVGKGTPVGHPFHLITNK